MLEAGLAEVRRLGYEPVVSAEITSRWRFHAGTEARRLEELRAAFADAQVRAVWCARGGEGITALLRGLDAAALAGDPKPVVGESDATALGCWALSSGVGWLHGPMVASALRHGETGYVESSLRAALAGLPQALAPAATRTLREGTASGVLWGGCLSLLAAACGTPWLPRLGESVLVLEDVGVKPYQVHRMLVQLRDAGALDGVRGVVLGDFSSSVQHADQGYDVADVLADFFTDALGDVPVTIGWPIGHAPAPHLTLPMGSRSRLEASAGGSVLHVEGMQ
jgi:muramoyltetrapeptide carboxypeptidase